MQLERLRRGGKQIRSEEAETLLAHTHLRKLVGKSSNRGLPVRRLLTEPWRSDVLRFLWRTSIVWGLRSGLRRNLLLGELALRGETRGEELGLLSRLSRDGTVGRARRDDHRIRAIVSLRLTGRILSTFCVMRRLRGWGCTWSRIEAWALHALGIRKGRFPLRPTCRGL